MRTRSGGVGHRRLVDHDQVSGAEAPALVVALRGVCGQPILGGEPAGDVAGVEALAGEDLGGDLRGRQADHPARLPVLRSRFLPGLGEGADHEALAGAGRADQGLDLRAGGEDPAYGGGLVGAELDALGGESGDEPVGLGHRQGGCLAVGGGGREEPLLVQVLGRRVEPAARSLVGRRPVGQAELLGQRGVTRSAGVQRNRQLQGLGGQPVEKLADLRGVEVAELVGQGVAQGPGEVRRGPGRLRLLDLGQRGLDHLADRPRHLAVVSLGLVEDVGGDLGQPAADLGPQLGVPSVQPLGDGLALVRLGVAGGEGGAALQPVQLERVR